MAGKNSLIIICWKSELFFNVNNLTFKMIFGFSLYWLTFNNSQMRTEQSKDEKLLCLPTKKH